MKLKIAKEKVYDEKKNNLYEKYNDITEKVIEEDNEEDNEGNELVLAKKLSSKLINFNRKNDDNDDDNDNNFV